MSRGRDRLAQESGAVLLLALLVTAVVAALGGALALLGTSESLTSASYRTAHEAFYAADSGVDVVTSELRRLADWSAVLLAPPGNLTSDFDDGELMPRAPDGTTLDLEQLTRAVQADSQARFGGIGFDADAPVWRLYAHGRLDRLLPGAPAMPAYVVVWVADDVEDGDGDPERDANGVILMRSVAFGLRRAHRAIEATLAREIVVGAVVEAPVRLVSWREVR